ncbi:MAG: PIN domain-containing protein [Armatimonadetes bacterium]|nr:PIN domain-containing protein [Armatimonadota bacterium]
MKTLVDAGPLIAAVNRGDTYHAACAALLRAQTDPLYTTMSVLTEAMYVAGARLGWTAQEALWRVSLRGDLLLVHPDSTDMQRMSALMHRYRDLPMDLADASLVVAAERLGTCRIITLDRKDFSVYRLHGRRAFEIAGP